MTDSIETSEREAEEPGVWPFPAAQRSAAAEDAARAFGEAFAEVFPAASSASNTNESESQEPGAHHFARLRAVTTYREPELRTAVEDALVAVGTPHQHSDFIRAACQWNGLVDLVEQKDRRIAELEREVHNLNWAMGTEGYPQMATPEEQAEADAAHASTMALVEDMKARIERHDALVPKGTDYLDVIEQQRARIAALGGACEKAAEEFSAIANSARDIRLPRVVLVKAAESALSELRAVSEEA